MSRPRLLDLFCGVGGAGAGYARAGFDVLGVDIEPQPRYPFDFVQADALTYPLDGFDAIHASPPCQAYSITRHLPWLADRERWDSIPPTRAALAHARVPVVIENVVGAPLDGIMLCGTMFDLRTGDGRPIYRHRLFETSAFLLAPGHPKHFETVLPGRLMGARLHASGDDGIGVDWAGRDERSQAVPPAYTEWIGHRLLEQL